MTPPPIDVISTNKPMTFPEAIKEITDGKRVTRLAWKPNDSYGILKDGWLMLWIDGQFKKWLVNDGDLSADDWVLIEN